MTRSRLDRRLNRLGCDPACVTSLLLLYAIAAPAQAELIGVEADASDAGVFVIDETGAGADLVGFSGVGGLNALAMKSSGVLYSAAQSLSNGDPADNLVTIDPWTGEATIVASLSGITAPSFVSMAFSPNDELFAIQYEQGNSNALVKVDPNTGLVTVVGPINMGGYPATGIQGLEFDAAGALYGWGTFWGLVTIDTSDGSITDIGPYAGGSASIQTLAFAPDSTLYGVGTKLYTVEVSTGAVTQVGSGTLPDIRGIAVLPEPSLVTLLATSIPTLAAVGRRRRLATAAGRDRVRPGTSRR